LVLDYSKKGGKKGENGLMTQSAVDGVLLVDRKKRKRLQQAGPACPVRGSGEKGRSDLENYLTIPAPRRKERGGKWSLIFSLT